MIDSTNNDILTKIANAKELVNELEKIVCDVDHGQELSDLADQVCESLHMPVWKTNPLFARTIACCRSTEKEN